MDENELLARAAKRVVLTTEAVTTPGGSPTPDKVHIPSFLVDAVVHVKGGAAPCGCYDCYEPDDGVLRQFVGMKGIEGLGAYLERYQKADGAERGGAYAPQ